MAKTYSPLYLQFKYQSQILRIKMAKTYRQQITGLTSTVQMSQGQVPGIKMATIY